MFIEILLCLDGSIGLKLVFIIEVVFFLGDVVVWENYIKSEVFKFSGVVRVFKGGFFGG